jgi:hypothetical protein
MASEKLIQKHMQSLGITREEAIQLIADDVAIDKGAKLFSLSSEQEKESKKARQADRKPTVYNFDTSKRKRAENSDKRFLIQNLQALLGQIQSEDVEVTNPEREIVFHFNGVKYKIVLSAPRS